MGDVGAARIGLQPLSGGMDDEIHVLHRHGTKQHGISEHQGAHETRTALKGHPYRAHIGHLHHSAIGHGDFSQRFMFQLKLHHDMFGNAEHEGTRVCKGRDLQGMKVGLARVAQRNRGLHVAHQRWMSTGEAFSRH
jgi:hypothetical protein